MTLTPTSRNPHIQPHSLARFPSEIPKKKLLNLTLYRSHPSYTVGVQLRRHTGSAPANKKERRQHDPTFPALNRKRSLWRTMATLGAAGDSAKAMVAEQISQSVRSTSNLLHLMQHSSPTQAQLIKLPKNLMAKVCTIKNTEQVLEQLPGVISSLDAHMENGLQNIPHLKTVVQLLANMESSQLSSLSRTDALEKVSANK